MKQWTERLAEAHSAFIDAVSKALAAKSQTVVFANTTITVAPVGAVEGGITLDGLGKAILNGTEYDLRARREERLRLGASGLLGNEFVSGSKTRLKLAEADTARSAKSIADKAHRRQRLQANLGKGDLETEWANLLWSHNLSSLAMKPFIAKVAVLALKQGVDVASLEGHKAAEVTIKGCPGLSNGSWESVKLLVSKIRDLEAAKAARLAAKKAEA